MATESLSSGLSLTRSPDLVLIADTPKGRGVFAARDIPARTVIETCPVLVLGLEEDEEHVSKTSLFHYTYNWPCRLSNGESRTTQAIIFGLGSMFNHSRHQNVGWDRDVEKLLITYKTLRDIKVGEELCISYGSRLTFKDTDADEMDEEDSQDMLSRIQVD